MATDNSTSKIEPRTRTEQLLDRMASSLETISAQHGKFIVTFSGETSREENTATCDRTYEEIKDAYDNGYYIECRYRYGRVVPMVTANEGLFRFACDWHFNYGDEPTVCGISATIYNDGRVSVYIEGEA